MGARSRTCGDDDGGGGGHALRAARGTDKSDNRSYRASTDKTDNDKTDNTILSEPCASPACTSERRGSTFNDLYLKAKARIWP